MRDLNRIDCILDRLGVIWKKFPDLRLGQLVLNVWQDPSMYYVEDEEFINEIESFYNGG